MSGDVPKKRLELSSLNLDSLSELFSVFVIGFFCGEDLGIERMREVEVEEGERVGFLRDEIGIGEV